MWSRPGPAIFRWWAIGIRAVPVRWVWCEPLRERPSRSYGSWIPRGHTQYPAPAPYSPSAAFREIFRLSVTGRTQATHKWAFSGMGFSGSKTLPQTCRQFRPLATLCWASLTAVYLATNRLSGSGSLGPLYLPDWHLPPGQRLFSSHTYS